MNKYRALVFLSLIIIIPIAFASKLYRGPLDWWINDHLGGLWYEIFWMLLIVLIRPKSNLKKVAFTVFLLTAIIEFLQLWHPPFLEIIRSTFIGRGLIGNTFTWSDFIYYIIGCSCGWYWLKFLQKVSY